MKKIILTATAITLTASISSYAHYNGNALKGVNYGVVNYISVFKNVSQGKEALDKLRLP